MEDKVDILLTTYNTKIEYLIKQIDSILTQTYTNISLIISDDNSTNKEVQAVTLETVTKLTQILSEGNPDKSEPEIMQISVSCAAKLGRYHMMKPEDPVYIFVL